MAHYQHNPLDTRNPVSPRLNVNDLINEGRNIVQPRYLDEVNSLSKTLLQAAQGVLPPLRSSSQDINTFTVQEIVLHDGSNDWGQTTYKPDVICPNASFLRQPDLTEKFKSLKFGCLCDSPGHDDRLEYEATLAIELFSRVLALQAVNDKKYLSKDPKEVRILGDSVQILNARIPSEAFPGDYPSRYRSRRIVELYPSPGLELCRRIIIRRTSQFAVREDTQDMAITISKHSTVEHWKMRQKPLWVILSGVDLEQDNSSLENVRVKVIASEEDAAHFAANMLAFRNRLLQYWARGPLKDEFEVRLLCGNNASDPVPEGREDVNISLVLPKSHRTKENEMRMIMRRNENACSLCIDFGDKMLEVAERGLLKSMDLVRLWVCEYDDWDSLYIKQKNWNKLMARGARRREKPKSQSRGGAQLLGGTQLLRSAEPTQSRRTLMKNSGSNVPRRDQSHSSDDWFDRVEDLRMAMTAPKSVKGEYSRVKVCVIDTGFNPKDKDVKKITKYKDFVDRKSNSMSDNTWHGTLSATTVLSIHEDCELYVARVFNTNDTDDKTEPELMAQAIEWAIEPEQDVDIISISAGFMHHSPRLQEAVKKASCANKLIFAAAANWGNSGPVAFPACHDLYTICISATNSLSKDSTFNPEHRAESHNFAVLGEDFQHPADPIKRLSGTSMATAAAAGLAALIVDFSRQEDNRGAILRVADVGKMLGMIAIFNSMATKTGKFKCVVPTNLLPSDYSSLRPEEKRSYVRDSISRAMDKAN